MIALSEAAKPIDHVFRALSDPTRRHVLERLSRSPAFVQHMGILEECGLVQSRKTGRVRTYEIIPKRLKLAEDWMIRQRTLWEKRLDQLDTYLTTLKET
jgi:DNA-binding transcriptional ArsR family regulator